MVPVDIRNIRAHSAAMLTQHRASLTEGELRKELAVARGNLARLKVRGDVETLRRWSARTLQTAEAGVRVGAWTWAIVAAVNFWRHRHQSRVPPASRWVKALGLAGSLLLHLRSPSASPVANAPAAPDPSDARIAPPARR